MEKQILLIADDDEMNRMIIRKFLKQDYEILEAVDGQEAMDILRSQHVDALLLDIIMPQLDGLKVLGLMKEDHSFDHIGILVATSTKEKTEREALSLGADDIVSKPYDPVVIKKRMENILMMKQINMQKNHLQNDETTTYLLQRNGELSKKVENVVERIAKFADIINANKSNYKLVDEIAGEIKAEANGILDIINSQK